MARPDGSGDCFAVGSWGVETNLAGIAAEQVAGFVGRGFLTSAPVGCDGDWREAWKSLPRGTHARRLEALNRALDRARARLAAHWPAVKRLAEDLRLEGEVCGGRAIEIIRSPLRKVA